MPITLLISLSVEDCLHGVFFKLETIDILKTINFQLQTFNGALSVIFPADKYYVFKIAVFGHFLFKWHPTLTLLVQTHFFILFVLETQLKQSYCCSYFQKPVRLSATMARIVENPNFL